MNIINDCGVKYGFDGAFQSHSLSDFASVAFAWGAFYGMLFQKKFTPGIIAGSLQKDEGCWKKWARIGIAVLLTLPGLAMLLGIAYGNADNPYVLMIF